MFSTSNDRYGNTHRNKVANQIHQNTIRQTDSDWLTHIPTDARTDGWGKTLMNSTDHKYEYKFYDHYYKLLQPQNREKCDTDRRTDICLQYAHADTYTHRGTNSVHAQREPLTARVLRCYCCFVVVCLFTWSVCLCRGLFVCRRELFIVKQAIW